jgi:hypothetical protein
MQITIQVSCQSRKTAENGSGGSRLGRFANQDLAGFANPAWEHSPAPARRSTDTDNQE